MTILATQKKIMSKPVTRTDDGKKWFSNSFLSGQPKDENGTKAELNQVSNTSGSLVRVPE